MVTNMVNIIKQTAYNLCDYSPCQSGQTHPTDQTFIPISVAPPRLGISSAPFLFLPPLICRQAEHDPALT